jgi:hypothetical protein
VKHYALKAGVPAHEHGASKTYRRSSGSLTIDHDVIGKKKMFDSPFLHDVRMQSSSKPSQHRGCSSTDFACVDRVVRKFRC